MIVRLLIAFVMGGAILWLGVMALRAASGVGRRTDAHEIEDVEGLDVFLLCRECGTEFRVTRLGQLQVPRHCGEPMEVVHRPRAGGTGPSSN